MEQNEGARRQRLRRRDSGACAVSVDTPYTELLPVHLHECLKFQLDSLQLPAIRLVVLRPVAQA